MSRLSLIVLVAGSLGVAALAIACGGSSKSSSSASSSGAASGATRAPAATAPAAPQIINVKDVENGQAYAFDPNQITVKAGQVVVHYTNPAESTRAHTFELKTLDGNGDVVKSEEIQPGASVDLAFAVTAPGTYKFLCYRPGHADRGQTGTLTVTGPQG